MSDCLRFCSARPLHALKRATPVLLFACVVTACDNKAEPGGDREGQRGAAVERKALRRREDAASGELRERRADGRALCFRRLVSERYRGFMEGGERL